MPFCAASLSHLCDWEARSVWLSPGDLELDFRAGLALGLCLPLPILQTLKKLLKFYFQTEKKNGNNNHTSASLSLSEDFFRLYYVRVSVSHHTPFSFLLILVLVFCFVFFLAVTTFLALEALEEREKSRLCGLET